MKSYFGVEIKCNRCTDMDCGMNCLEHLNNCDTCKLDFRDNGYGFFCVVCGEVKPVVAGRTEHLYRSFAICEDCASKCVNPEKLEIDKFRNTVKEFIKKVSK